MFGELHKLLPETTFGIDGHMGSTEDISLDDPTTDICKDNILSAEG